MQYTDNRGGQTTWMRRYTAFLGGKETPTNDYVAGSYPFKQSFTIANRELARRDGSFTAVENWWTPIASSSRYPVWLRKAALNELYQMVFMTSFWESGLVKTTQQLAAGGPRLGSEIPGLHLFGTINCSSGGDTAAEEMDVDSYGYLSYTKLFPNLERGRVLAWLQSIEQSPYGAIPENIPFTSGPYLSRQAVTGMQPPQQGNLPTAPTGLGTGGDFYRDCPHKVIYRAYALYKQTQDATLVTYGFAPMLKTLKYTQAFRLVGSHLPLDPPSESAANTYDQVPVDGHGIYNSQLYLLSLQILVTLAPIARKLGVAEASVDTQHALEQELSLAKAEFEKTFWNPATRRYRFCDGTGGIAGREGTRFNTFKPVQPPDVVFLDSFFAQGIAAQLGLPDLINLEHAQIHMKSTLDAFLSSKDATGHSMGAVNFLDEDLKPFKLDMTHIVSEIPEVWIGTNYMAAAAYVYTAKKRGDTDLAKSALRMGEAVAYQIYDVADNGYAFDPPDGWFSNDLTAYRNAGYSRPRAVWQLIDALDYRPRGG
ncbi:hypothetical protein I6A60_17105 [Frankia sp. AgB1.9]|uniref:GH116 family glycosyl hydrolase n=1 Tax=unclassified Frankia TaxID=2632575 RepID=UPI001933E417|nr:MULTISPECIES: GH116 family glycosyl hydrolase [unclassified Frankia]MBL7493302.1 hypothetical protein [Frankia sp. AgW1.1]MBL7549581.1 hypothetical protein [Frankia sp. AgB1.9]MBL7620439.1 hypothetical protein [Frankia sp. AgB1.8]